MFFFFFFFFFFLGGGGGGVRKMNVLLIMLKLWIFLGINHKTGLILGVISIYCRFFFLKKYFFFIWGGGGGVA